MKDVSIVYGLSSRYAPAAAHLLVDAFEEKVAHEIRPTSREQADRIVLDSFLSDRAWLALDADDSLVGIIAIGTKRQPFSRLSFRLLRREFGFPGALWRKAFALLEEVFVSGDESVPRVEVLAVREDVRGCGIGRRLLDAVIGGAREAGARAVSLEVVDTNPRARVLYESVGFRPVRSIPTGFLTAGGGYRGVHFMRRDL
jgi:ribosomal protein S18 acetylase RimI-like enzyme